MDVGITAKGGDCVIMPVYAFTLLCRSAPVYNLPSCHKSGGGGGGGGGGYLLFSQIQMTVSLFSSMYEARPTKDY